jgi:DNA-directed RNA polymerase subunit RPC12/RpoP
MGTVKLQCGQCGKLMTVKEEHVGRAVRCPYCQTVVKLAPPNTPSPVPASPPAEDTGRPDGVVLPEVAETKPSSLHAVFGLEEEPLSSPASKPPEEASDFLPGNAREELKSENAFADHPPPPEELPGPSFSAPRPARKDNSRSTSIFVLILLLFVIPYCLTSTAVIAWLLYQQREMREQDPLERMPDPKSKPEDGGARQVRHDASLPPHLETTLRQPITVGALEVTPTQVFRTEDNDLMLVLDMHNVSEDQEFSPVHPDFAEPKTRPDSYTFLEAKDRSQGRLYGGKFHWVPPAEQNQPLRPGQHMIVQLTTGPKDRTSVRWFLEHPQEMVWRVQVRRGLMSTSNGLRSATAVIGVVFNIAAVEKS